MTLYSTEDARGRLPAKQRGAHRWVLTALYAVTEDALLKEGSVVDHENLLGVEAGCLDCERAYGQHPRYCPADAYTGFD